MEGINGIYKGEGTEINLNERNISIKEFKILIEIKFIKNNTYIIKSQYFNNITNNIEFNNTFLFLKKDNEDTIVCEDSTGMGINIFEFEKDNCTQKYYKLVYKYNINSNNNSLTGEYLLFKTFNQFNKNN